MEKFDITVKDGRPRWRHIFDAVGRPSKLPRATGAILTIAAGPGRPQLHSELGAWDRLHGERWVIQGHHFAKAIGIAEAKRKRLNTWCSGPLMLKRPALNDGSCEHEILFAWTVHLLFLETDTCSPADLREICSSVAAQLLESTNLYWAEFELNGQTVCMKCPANKDWRPPEFKWPAFQD